MNRCAAVVPRNVLPSVPAATGTSPAATVYPPPQPFIPRRRSPGMVLEAILAHLDSLGRQHLDELLDWLRIPSISAQSERAADQLRAAEWAVAYLREAGLRAELRNTAGYPVIVGGYDAGPDAPTVLLYGHYDVQPPEPLELWDSPPFIDGWGGEPPTDAGASEPVRDGAIFARGASDDKGQIFCHFAALRGWLEHHGRLPVTVKLLIEGEEEIGSPSLEAFVAENAEALRADYAVVSDSSMYTAEIPALTTGLRGLAYFQLDIEGAARDLHSGSHGGGVANPANVLAAFLATLHNPDGSINLPGIYDDVVATTEEERAAFAALGFDDDAYRAEVGAPTLAGEAGYTTLERRWTRPSLDINGLWGGYAGEGAKTVLPAKAGAKFSLRLVPHQDPERVAQAVRRAADERLPSSVRWELTAHHGARPVLTPTDSPGVRAALRALAQGFDREAVFIREGGTIPVVEVMQRVLGTTPLLMGFGLPEDRAHAPNERFGLANLNGGIRASAALWAGLARA